MPVMSDKHAVVVDELWKSFRLYQEKNQYLKATILKGRRAKYREFWALKGVEFEVPHGQTFGVIGPNGSGKSTLLKCMAGILRPEKGRATVHGRVSALLELGAGFHMELTGRENVFLNGAILGLTKREVELRFDDIVAFAGLEEFIDTPVKNYSSGMFVRLGFAVAAHVEPEVLLIDEVLSVGDESFQRQCAEKIEQFRTDGRTIVFVSHGLGQVEQLCERVAWIDHGELADVGPAADIITKYRGESHDAERVQGELGTTVGQSRSRGHQGRLRRPRWRARRRCSPRSSRPGCASSTTPTNRSRTSSSGSASTPSTAISCGERALGWRARRSGSPRAAARSSSVSTRSRCSRASTTSRCRSPITRSTTPTTTGSAGSASRCASSAPTMPGCSTCR